MSTNENDGHWRTIDGTHVFIKGGVITKGPAALTGKKPSELPAHQALHEKLGDSEASYHGAKAAEANAAPRKTFAEMHPPGSPLRKALEKYEAAHPTPKATHKITDVTPEGYAPKDSGYDDRAYDPERLKAPDATQVQKHRNAIQEGKVLLRGKLSPEKRAQIQRSIDNSQAKLDRLLNHEPKAAMSQNFILPTEDSDARAVPMALAGFSREIDGQPVEYRRKEICRAGRTVKDVAGNPFSITRERIDQWINNFQRQSENGTKVFIPTKHTEILSTDNRGFVISMERDGDSLYAVEQLIGADAIVDAARNDQSVYIKSDLQDDQGNVYEGEYIQHVALTPAPQITGLNGFAKVAASRGADAEAVVLTIATTSEPERSFDMKPEISAKLREKLGVAKSVTDEQLMEQVAEKFLAPPDPAIVAMSKADADKLKADKEAAERERDEQKDKVVAMSRLNPKVDEDTAFLLGRTISKEREAAIASGGVCPAVADEIQALLIEGAGNLPNTVAMSRMAGSRDPYALRLWEALRKNKPTTYGEKTGRQDAVAMSRAPEDKLPREGDKPSDEEAAKAGQEQGEKWKNDQLKARGLPVEAA